MHKRMLLHGDKDYIGESINLLNNYIVNNIIFNCGKYNYLEKGLLKDIIALDKLTLLSKNKYNK